jgi:hypothetical protein
LIRAYSFADFGEYNEAYSDIEKILDLEPNHRPAFRKKIDILGSMKKIDELEQIARKDPEHRYIKLINATIFALKGQKEEAFNDSTEFSLFFKSNIYSILGMKDEAISNLINKFEKFYKNSSGFFSLTNNSIYDSLRDDLRFQKLLSEEKKKYDDLLKKYGEDL